MSEAQLSGDQRAIQRFLGVIEPFKDDLSGARMAAAQRFYIRHKSGGSAQSMLARSATGSRQALVKVIRNGGAKTMAQLGTQIDYVTREGTLEAKDNPLGEYYEAALSGEALQEKLFLWQQDFKGTPKLGHTTHVMVSFPAGTDRKAAEDAALEFGTRAFSSDLGGDCYDWVAVQHNDTHYPHMHFIVKNRGMFEGGWFTIKRGSAHDVNTLRVLQVEAAAEFGIELTATRRLERGITAPAVMTDEYRQAQLEGRAPHIVPRTAIEQHILNEIVIDHAETLEMLAETYDQMAGETVAQLLRDSAALLKNGKEINVSRDINIIEHHAIGPQRYFQAAIFVKAKHAGAKPLRLGHQERRKHGFTGAGLTKNKGVPRGQLVRAGLSQMEIEGVKIIRSCSEMGDRCAPGNASGFTRWAIVKRNHIGKILVGDDGFSGAVCLIAGMLGKEDRAHGDVLALNGSAVHVSGTLYQRYDVFQSVLILGMNDNRAMVISKGEATGA